MQNPFRFITRLPNPLRSDLFLSLAGGFAIGIGLVAAFQSSSAQARMPDHVPNPTLSASASGAKAVAVFAGGCFWGVEAVFEHVNGVSSVTSGYSGGGSENATYAKVGSGRTGHAEAVRVVYDPTKVSYGQLLQVFFTVAHDPTEKDRQGPDVGSQYRGAVFPVNKAQERAATAFIATLDKSGHFDKPIATGIEPYKGFYRAEKSHQDFLRLNPRHPYIVRWDLPKLADLKKRFPTLYRG